VLGPSDGRLDIAAVSALVADLRYWVSSWTAGTGGHSGRVMSQSGSAGGGGFFVLAEALRALKAGPLSDHPSDWSIPGFMHTWIGVTQLCQVALL